jgi:hypothetical protein
LEGILLGKSAQVDEQQNKGNNQTPSHLRNLRQSIQEKEADRYGDKVRDNDDPNKGKGQIEFSLGRGNEHVGSRHDALDDKRSQQNRHDDTCRHSKSDRRN